MSGRLDSYIVLVSINWVYLDLQALVIRPSCSIGVVNFPKDGKNTDAL